VLINLFEDESRVPDCRLHDVFLSEAGFVEFHRSLKEEEVWTAEYRSLAEARGSIARWIEEYNHDRPHRGVQNRTPQEAFSTFAVLTKNEALSV